jgi:hypothetical protein
MRIDVVDHELADGGAGFDRGAALMGLYDHIGQFQQRRRNVRLVLEHVECGVPEPALDQRADQRSLVDYRTASDVDQCSRRPERIDDRTW